MLKEPWLAIVIIIGILAVLGKCVEMQYYRKQHLQLKEEFRLLEEETNYIKYNNMDNVV